jgi:hypothetical protein
MVEAMGLKNYRIVVPFNDISSLPNLMKIYQAVQKMSTNPLYLKPAMLFRSFLPYSEQISSGFHSNIIAFMYFLRYSKLNALVTILTLCKDCV